MKASSIVLVGLFLSAPLARAAHSVPADDAAKSAQSTPSPNFYDEKADAKPLIAAAVARAKRENRRVLLQWGGNWCVWCHRLHDLCGSDKDLAKKLLYEYEVVYVDSLKDGKNLDLAASYGSDLKAHGVPYLTVLDGDGKVVANQETGVLEKEIDGKKGHDPKLVLEFLEKNQASYLEADELFDKAIARAKAENKRVFLHFGAPWCPWCRKLDAWMRSPAIEPVLAKDFIDLKIDIDRTIGGGALMKRFRAEDGAIPWFALLDAGGSVLAESGKGKANIGFPSAPDEIERFAAIIDGARRNITPEDVEALKHSLAPAPKKSE
jgi:thiol-disulfide isomerase/thioredoxin